MLAWVEYVDWKVLETMHLMGLIKFKDLSLNDI